MWDNTSTMCEPRISPRSFIANCLEPMPMPGKLKLILMNTLLKCRNLATCCGHIGQPGC